MNEEIAREFAGLMEEYLNIPSFVCENIEKNLIKGNSNEVIEYVIQRRNEVENKETYMSRQDINKMCFELQQEKKELQKLINTILNWNIFKEECPMNFRYENESIEDKAQEVFYQNDDYCENNCNEDYKKCWLKYFKKMQELKGESDE